MLPVAARPPLHTGTDWRSSAWCSGDSERKLRLSIMKPIDSTKPRASVWSARYSSGVWAVAGVV